MKYRVVVTRTITETVELEVEADNIETAENIAEEEALLTDEWVVESTDLEAHFVMTRDRQFYTACFYNTVNDVWTPIEGEFETKKDAIYAAKLRNTEFSLKFEIHKHTIELIDTWKNY